MERLPRKFKKEIKKWVIKTFPNYPFKLTQKKVYVPHWIHVYYDCRAEKRNNIRAVFRIQ